MGSGQVPAASFICHPHSVLWLASNFPITTSSSIPPLLIWSKVGSSHLPQSHGDCSYSEVTLMSVWHCDIGLCCGEMELWLQWEVILLKGTLCAICVGFCMVELVNQRLSAIHKSTQCETTFRSGNHLWCCR